jgi:hypothetical protein
MYKSSMVVQIEYGVERSHGISINTTRYVKFVGLE